MQFFAREGFAEHAKLIEGLGTSVRSGSDDGHMEHSGQTDQRVGLVDHVAAVGTYGFVQEESGDRWYFRKNDVAPSDWDRLAHGARVSFQMGRNPQGPCAVNLRVL